MVADEQWQEMLDQASGTSQGPPLQATIMFDQRVKYSMRPGSIVGHLMMHVISVLTLTSCCQMAHGILRFNLRS